MGAYSALAGRLQEIAARLRSFPAIAHPASRAAAAQTWYPGRPTQPALSGRAKTMAYLYLLTAIVFEVAATSTLKMTEGFTRLWPTAFTLLGYGLAFYFLSLTLRTIPVGVANALWSGIGVELI